MLGGFGGNMNTLKSTLDMVRSLKSASDIKVNRNFEGFFADRIVQSFAQPTLLDSVEHLAKAVNAGIEYVGGKKTADFMKISNADDASAVLAWIREHPRIVAMIAALRDDQDYTDALTSIEIDVKGQQDNSVVTGMPIYDVEIKADLLSPLSHGGDTKAGNATLFRRRQAITETGRILNLPYYSGNAVRGQMRDLLADHLLSHLGLTPRKDKPPVNLWFFHTLYAGGVLQEQNKAMEKVNKVLGLRGNIKTEGLRNFRDMLPSLSLLGSAMSNRILSGRVAFGDLRPVCREWGNGNIPVAEIMDWTFLTRREDHEGRTDEDDHTGMIANTEVIKSGVKMIGGIDINSHASDLERAALGCGLALLEQRGMLGAQNRRGLGKVSLIFENAPDPQPYLKFISSQKDKILDYLSELGALNCTLFV